MTRTRHEDLRVGDRVYLDADRCSDVPYADIVTLHPLGGMYAGRVYRIRTADIIGRDMPFWEKENTTPS